MKYNFNHKLTQALNKVTVGDSVQERSYFNQHQYRYLKTLDLTPASCVQNKVIADLGTLPGYLAIAMRKLGGAEVYGLDYDPERFGFKARIEQQGVIIIKCNIEKENLPFEDKTIDTVTFTEVIEHFAQSPTRALQEIRRILKPQGTLIITTPNRHNLANHLRTMLGKNLQPSEHETGHLPEQQHHHEYTMKELRAVLQKEGFAIEHQEFIAGTEMAILEGSFPKKLPRFMEVAYAHIARKIPPFRSYLYVRSKI